MPDILDDDFEGGARSENTVRTDVRIVCRIGHRRIAGPDDDLFPSTPARKPRCEVLSVGKTLPPLIEEFFSCSEANGAILRKVCKVHSRHVAGRVPSNRELE